MATLVYANGKGGVGKSTLVALLIEYCNHLEIPVALRDVDPIATSSTWARYCEEDGRAVLQSDPEVTAIDTAGASGGALKWMSEADLIVCPLQANFADLDSTVTWFQSLNPTLQAKFVFVPNMVGQAKEQQFGQEDLERILGEVGHGMVAPGLRRRDAIYPMVLKGSGTNFFADTTRRTKNAREEAERLCTTLLEQVGYQFEEDA